MFTKHNCLKLFYPIVKTKMTIIKSITIAPIKMTYFPFYRMFENNGLDVGLSLTIKYNIIMKVIMLNIISPVLAILFKIWFNRSDT